MWRSNCIPAREKIHVMMSSKVPRVRCDSTSGGGGVVVYVSVEQRDGQTATALHRCVLYSRRYFYTINMCAVTRAGDGVQT